MSEMSKQLLRRFSKHEVGFIVCIDGKMFTVTPPLTRKNDRVYSSVTLRKRDVSASRLLRVSLN